MQRDVCDSHDILVDETENANVSPQSHRGQVALQKSVCSGEAELAQESALHSVQWQQDRIACMEYGTTTAIQMAENVGFVLCNEGCLTVETACPQKCGHLGRNLFHHFVHGHIHCELRVDPDAQQLEGVAMVVPSVDDCKLLLCGVEDDLVTWLALPQA